MAQIRIVGAHSTGKTRLARWISGHYAIPLIEEVAREVLAEMGVGSIDELRLDDALLERYQAGVFHRQLSREAEQGSGPWVSDRSIDTVAYACTHAPGAGQYVKLDTLQEWAARMRSGPVFLCRPEPALVEADGIRESPHWVGIHRIDAAVEMMLDILDIPFCPVTGADFTDRTRLVRYVIDPVISTG